MRKKEKKKKEEEVARIISWFGAKAIGRMRLLLTEVQNTLEGGKGQKSVLDTLHRR